MDRPCIILAINNQIRLATIIPLTTNLKMSTIPFTYTLTPNQLNNLYSESVVLIYQLRTISFDRLSASTTGKISESEYEEIRVLIKEYLHLD